MVTLFVALTLLAITMIAIFIQDAEDVLSYFLVLMYVGILWIFLALLPAMVHTHETDVSISQDHQVFRVNKYKSIILLGENDEVIPVTDAFLIDKVQAGEYNIEKHSHKNIFDGESISPTYFLVPTYK